MARKLVGKIAFPHRVIGPGEDADAEAAAEKYGVDLDDPRFDDVYGRTSATPDVDATDSAKALADENGLDLSSVKGTGTDGRILKSDVEKALE